MEFKAGDKVVHTNLGHCVFQFYGMFDEAVVETQNNKILIVSVSLLKKATE